VESGEWRVESEEWRVESEEWRVERGIRVGILMGIGIATHIALGDYITEWRVALPAQGLRPGP
jgi:hypothetical protein